MIGSLFDDVIATGRKDLLFDRLPRLVPIVDNQYITLLRNAVQLF